MQRIGLCTEFAFVPEAAELGFDYLELPLRDIAALSEEEFDEMANYTAAANLRVEVLNHMLPDSLRVTGADVSARRQHEYLSRAFSRAQRLGAQIVVFDAPLARSVPYGFDFALARRQAGNFLRIVQGHASQHALKVAVQSFRAAECNLINTVAEAATMAALLQLDSVGVMADTMQMALSAEPLDALVRTGSALMHLHTGAALTRALPHKGDGEDYTALFRMLKRCSYLGHVSCIAPPNCTPELALSALNCLKAARDA